MEHWLRNDARYKLLYNCSSYNVSRVPLAERANRPLGTLYFMLGMVQFVGSNIYSLVVFAFLLQTLYIPCVVSIWHRRAENTCHRLMFVMGIFYLLWIFYTGVIGGWFLFEGAVFCMHPNILYLTGCFSIRKALNCVFLKFIKFLPCWPWLIIADLSAMENRVNQEERSIIKYFLFFSKNIQSKLSLVPSPLVPGSH
jgi:hypothetical protein